MCAFESSENSSVVDFGERIVTNRMMETGERLIKGDADLLYGKITRPELGSLTKSTCPWKEREVGSEVGCGVSLSM